MNPGAQGLPHAAAARCGRVARGAPPLPAPRSSCSAEAWGLWLVLFPIDEHGGADGDAEERTWLSPPAPRVPAWRGWGHPALSADPGNIGCSFHLGCPHPDDSGKAFSESSGIKQPL